MMDGLYSIIFLSYNSESRVEKNSKLLMKRLKEEKIPFEIIIIDDGSTDNSFTIALELEKKYPEIRAYQLSKNYTSPYAYFAGLKMSKGDCVVPCADDLQRPIEVIIQMYRYWQEGKKLVIAHHVKRNDGFLNDFFSNLFYKIMNSFSDLYYPKGGAMGFLADREIVDIINADISPRNTSPTVEALRLGYEPFYFPFTRPTTDNKSRWTFKKKIRLASNNFFASSNFPIKFITWIGLATFSFSLIIIILIILAKLFGDNKLFGFPVQGWATIIVLVSFFNGLVLFCLGIVAEYIWRIFEEVKGRPGYIIKKKEDL